MHKLGKCYIQSFVCLLNNYTGCMCNILSMSIEQLHRALASCGETILWTTIWQNKTLPYYAVGCEGVHRVVDQARKKESEEALCVLFSCLLSNASLLI